MRSLAILCLLAAACPQPSRPPAFAEILAEISPDNTRTTVATLVGLGTRHTLR
jgi:hypothetical protein